MAGRKTLLIPGAIGGAILFAPASASASLSQCNNDHMCAWGNNNYQWLIAEQKDGRYGWLDPFNGAEENNQTDSYANTSQSYAGCLADGANGSGDRVFMARNSSDPNLAYFNSDEASSMKTRGGC